MEIWKDINNYDGLYRVSSYGNIWSKRRFGAKGGILEPILDKDGYHSVVLSKHNIKQRFKIHRLVALSFVDNPHDYPEVNHIDFNIGNNKSDNLNWATRQINISHTVDNKRNSFGEKVYNSKLKESDVTAIYASKESTSHLSGLFNISQSVVSNIRHGRSWKHLTTK